jgi:hypothetical protein
MHNGKTSRKLQLGVVLDSRKKGKRMAKKPDDALEQAQQRIAELEKTVADRLSKAEKFCVFSKNDYRIYIELRANDLWAITHLGECMTAEGNWVYEPRLSEQGDEFKAQTRFPFDRAWALAEAKVQEVLAYGQDG